MDKSTFNNRKEWRKFAYGLGAILLIIATVMIFRSNQLFPYFYGGAGLIALIGFVIPILIKPVYIFFLYLGEVLGWIMTRIVLGIVFFIVLTPIGLIMRLFGMEFLPFFKKSSDTYWVEKDNSRTKESMYEKQY